MLTHFARPARRLTIAIALIIGLIFLFSRDHGIAARGMGSGPIDVFNSTLGFGKIFVVNLPERTDRRDLMTLAAAVTGLEFTYIPGVRGADIPEKVLPPSPRKKNVNWAGKTGSWRAHMNVLQRIVQENLTSALIMEDDADWDIRLKSQAQTFAVASQAYLQPLQADPSHTLADLYPALSKILQEDNYVCDLQSAPATRAPSTSPYGDGWDVLWLGHVGSHIPSDWPSHQKNSDHPPLSLLTLLVPDDGTVADKRHLKRHPFADRIDDFAARFESHTRVVHEARGTAGIQAYAVSQRGARRLLLKFGLEEFTSSYDLMLRDWCDGAYVEDKGERPVCVTTQPPLMSQYYSKGGSDIHGIGGGYFKKSGSTYIRHSVMLNLRKLVWRNTDRPGDIEGLVDQWPDEGKGPW
ncbi:hypothetical protein jhhlp_008111 [Lomentospora prolificans]|uniref:Glycosyl transferase family 25 domain-containing protein n=1 Tax=Lomentospora prolificans TaxID=41688 RepID=A0A2N3MZI3_9PEZI|nr:hypothetical protein jhhlp_008111 [Lomentospora prolificans]